MHLTPEYRSIGQENFHAAIGSPLMERDLLKKINAEELKLGAGLGAEIFGYGTVEKPIRVAVIGTGDQGSVLMGAINPKYVQVVAIADIRPFNQHRAFHGDVSSPNASLVRPGLMKVYGWETEEEARKHVKVFGDYNDLFEYYKDKKIGGKEMDDAPDSGTNEEGDEGENTNAQNSQEEEGIEAIFIGLPLFLHAPVAVKAMEQGYHVLTEKLMAHNVAECKEMARAAVQYKKHCATGHQRHYNVLYEYAVKMIKSGLLGDLHYIRAQWHRNNQPGADSWRQPIPREIKPDDPQFDRLERILANYKRQLENPALAAPAKALLEKQVAQTESQIADKVLVEGGEYNGYNFKSARDYGYEDAELSVDGAKVYDRPAGEELIRWRLYDRTSAGLMAELGSHQLDAASIFLSAMLGGKQYPLSVSTTATRTIFPNSLEESPIDRDVEDHVHCVYEYPAKDYDPNDDIGKLRKITLAYSSINGNGFGGYGETIFGTKGTLLIETEIEAMLYNRADVHRKVRITRNSQGLQLTMDDEGDPLSAAIATQATAAHAHARGRGYCEQIEHWAYCIRENPEADHSKAMPRCYPEVALADAVITHVTNIAARKGETVVFKQEWFDSESDATPEAEILAEQEEDKKKFTPDLGRYA